MNVIGYVRVSTDDQGRNGYGLDAQRSAIRAECDRRGWTLVRTEEDVRSGGTMKRRPGVGRAIASCDNNEAQALVAAKVDRLSF
jgi:DNA invertase Pin-like site-specific DNA recombinase